MRTRLGGTLEGVLIGIAALVGLGAIGYTTFTGNCVSCIFTGAPESNTALVSSSEGPSTCSISGSKAPVSQPAAETVAATSETPKSCAIGCSMDEANTTLASAKSESQADAPSCCPLEAAATEQVAEKTGCCPMTDETLVEETVAASDEQTTPDEGEG